MEPTDTSTPEEKPEPAGLGPIVGIILAVLIVALTALYFTKEKADTPEGVIPDAPPLDSLPEFERMPSEDIVPGTTNPAPTTTPTETQPEDEGSDTEEESTPVE